MEHQNLTTPRQAAAAQPRVQLDNTARCCGSPFEVPRNRVAPELGVRRLLGPSKIR